MWRKMRMYRINKSLLKKSESIKKSELNKINDEHYV